MLFCAISCGASNEARVAVMSGASHMAVRHTHFLCRLTLEAQNDARELVIA